MQKPRLDQGAGADQFMPLRLQETLPENGNSRNCFWAARRNGFSEQA